jgi:hypothetical protein|tara:strand:+ start:538 stop:882 length:345 start_codon:yes stop_codon:yes gene_type:complete
MSFLDKSPAEEWDAMNKKRRAEARRINEAIKAEERVVSRLSTYDAINPSHYKDNGIECIEYIKERLPNDAFLGYLNGNVIKYTHRWKDKNGIEDLRKARWYLDKLIEEQCNGKD